jgi:dTDP-3-amino-3,4,6-trideoxy-alpha-D-glucose transaminase
VTSLASTGALSVPFIDLTPVNAEIKDDVLAAVSELIDRNEFGSGAAVTAFEESFAECCESDNAVGLASGLDALRLALLALGIGRGDEVIVPANTFVATFEAVSQAGARPVVVDVSEEDDNIDVTAAEAAVTRRTRAIMPVHLYGQMADVVALDALASARGLAVVEDACQAHGARRDGIRAGSAGRAAAFSFYPAKNLGAMGDAGALVTDDSELAENVRALREHGQRAKYRHDFEGFTSRLDALQAVVLSAKLPLLDRWNASRQDAAATYLAELDGVGDLRLPSVARGSIPVWHLFVARTKSRAQLQEFLSRRGIETGRHYPEPPHLSPAYAWLGHRSGSFPVAESVSQDGLSLPLFPGMTEEQLELVIDAIKEFFARG